MVAGARCWHGECLCSWARCPLLNCVGHRQHGANVAASLDLRRGACGSSAGLNMVGLFFLRCAQASSARPMDDDALLPLSNPLMNGTGAAVRTPEPVRLSTGARRKSRVSLNNVPSSPVVVADSASSEVLVLAEVAAPSPSVPLPALSPMRRSTSKPFKGLRHAFAPRSCSAHVMLQVRTRCR